jgi:hypothetical protein
LTLEELVDVTYLLINCINYFLLSYFSLNKIIYLHSSVKKRKLSHLLWLDPTAQTTTFCQLIRNICTLHISDPARKVIYFYLCNICLRTTKKLCWGCLKVFSKGTNEKVKKEQDSEFRVPQVNKNSFPG